MKPSDLPSPVIIISRWVRIKFSLGLLVLQFHRNDKLTVPKSPRMVPTFPVNFFWFANLPVQCPLTWYGIA